MNAFPISKSALLKCLPAARDRFAHFLQITLTHATACIILILLAVLTAHPGFAQPLEPDNEPPAENTAADSPRNAAEGQSPSAGFTAYLPTVLDIEPTAARMGFGATRDIREFSITDLRAGWYLDWRTRKYPARPNNMEYVQMVRLHQDITCPLGTTGDRVACPYKVPHSYTVWPSRPELKDTVKANPGSLWLIGNEIDRVDWPGGRQDEMLPELYAEAYHELYTLIKEADPTAKVANGGKVQITPLRLEYWNRAWNHYKQTYGTEMPVDVWNIHIFILPEAAGQWGADIPAGIDVKTGSYVNEVTGLPNYPMPDHINMELFKQQVESFRNWMKEHGQQNKPLIISEYGVLLPNDAIGFVPEPGEDRSAWQPIGSDNPEPVAAFMKATFDYFLDAKDCNVGYVADECRLVQSWVWYSLDDDVNFNRFGSLLNPQTGELSFLGKAFREYSLLQGRFHALMTKSY